MCTRIKYFANSLHMMSRKIINTLVHMVPKLDGSATNCDNWNAIYEKVF